MARLTLCVAQSPAELTGVSERLNWLKTTLGTGACDGADLLVLPELFASGYNIGAALNTAAQACNGTIARTIAALAKAHGIAIHYGYPELDAGLMYNAAQCFGLGGHALGHHRKLILPPGFESTYFTQGAGCSLFAINGLRIGTLICYDAEFPEAVRHVAKLGADLVLVPTALSDQWEAVARTVMPARAFENGVHLAYVNQAGREADMRYLGGSCIVGPQGSDLARAGAKSELLRAVIDTQSVVRAQARLPYLRDAPKLSL